MTKEDPKKNDEKIAIRVSDIYKNYGKAAVLKGLNLEVNKGETLVILGRSGAGKSVLLRQILGIETPDKGFIEVNGLRISHMSQTKKFEAVKSMGMLFQGAALFDSFTVGENVAFYLRQHNRLSEDEIQDRVALALKMVNLEGTESKMPSDISGGMRKRAGIARLIVYRPRILLYDEPTAGLDPITACQIDDLINKTQRELQATSIVVTHDVRSALEVGDRLAFHSEGKIKHIASKEEFMKIDDPLLHEFFENAMITPEFLDRLLKKGSTNA